MKGTPRVTEVIATAVWTCPIFQPGGSSEAIALLRNALICNGYLFAGGMAIWDKNLESTVRGFQGDMCLPITGIADLNTWMSLLLSSGNPDCSASVCDTRFEITETRWVQLISLGYNTIGRYLTGGDFKELRMEEPQRILDMGLKFFPIFQESGTNLSYFTNERGKQDATKAAGAARKFGLPNETIIYFVADTDVLEGNISTYIKPYFHGVLANLDHKYKVDVYGTRNVCTKIIDAGYAVTCFVSDMSTGFSSNMGFKIPRNWNYDQFCEISLYLEWGIDKLGYSERYPAVAELEVVPDETKIMDMINKIYQIEVLFKAYYESKYFNSRSEVHIMTSKILILGVTNFLRSGKYNDIKWSLAMGRGIDIELLSYVEANNSTLYKYFEPYITSDSKILMDDIGGKMDLGHLGATIEGYVSSFALATWSGWAGDVATGMGDVMLALKENLNQNVYGLAKKIVGSDTSTCNDVDLCCDADAIKIAELSQQTDSLNDPLTSAMKQYLLHKFQKI